MPRATSSVPGISSERLAAVSAGADRLITGYYSSSGSSLEVTAFAEDAGSQKITGPIHAYGNLSTVAASLAQQFGAQKDSSLNTNSPGLKEHAIALDSVGPAAIPHYELALQADPNFGPAYVGLVQSAIAANDGARAQQALVAASEHQSAFTPEDRADLQLETASLAHNNRARAEALAAVVSLGNPDAATLQALGDAEMAARKPAEAARHYSQAIALAPADANLRNLLAYAAMYEGNEAEARRAAAEYTRLRPQDPNASDTAGDIELAFGHLAEAEKLYLSTPEPRFQNYLPTWKAARARLMTGDISGATTIFEKHREALAAAGSPVAEYRSAEWLYLTGRRAEGASAMSRFAAKCQQPDLRAAAFTQAALWAVFDHDNAHAVEWSTLALHPAHPSSFVLAALARFLAQPAASPDEWRHRAETNFNGPNASDVRRLALGLALIHAKYFDQALPVWKQIYEATSLSEAAPAYLYARTLLETGHKAEAAPLLRLNPIPTAAVSPSFEGLYLPALFEWRKGGLRQ